MKKPFFDHLKEFMKEKYIKFINPEYIKFVENENKEIVAFAIIMPSFAKALQKMNGKKNITMPIIFSGGSKFPTS